MPSTTFSLRRLKDALPERFTVWVRWACAVTMVGYGLLLLMDLDALRNQAPLGALGEVGAAIVSLLAFLLTFRRRAVPAALLLVAGVALEVHWGIFLEGGLTRGGPVVLPLLILVGGALLGGSAPYLLAGAFLITVPCALLLAGWSRGVGADLLAASTDQMVVVAIVLLATAVLLQQALKAYRLLLERSEERARRIAGLLEDTPDAILPLTAQMRVAAANPAAEELFGLRLAALRDRKLDELGLRALPPGAGYEPRPDVVASPFELVVAGTREPVELLLLRPDGERRVVEAMSGERSAGEGTQLVLRDVTRRFEAEEQRRALEESLHYQQRLEAVGRLAGGLAHDFNNLFTVIGGVAEILGLDTEAEYRDLAGDLKIAQSRGSLLVRKLLAFAQREAVDLRRLSLAAVVRESEVLLESLTGDAVRLEIQEEDEAWIDGDARQLELILVNLVSNAADAIKGAGRVIVRIGTGSEPMVEGWVVLEVRDDGVGMDEVTMERIFDPFFTTKHDGSGTGLGLATVFGIVEQHGARVDVESEPGQGTTVRILWPPQAPPSAEERTSAA